MVRVEYRDTGYPSTSLHLLYTEPPAIEVYISPGKESSALEERDLEAQ